ncbi:MAG: glycosyltransferase family 2 protein [Bacteroidales bacterium]
MNNFPSISIIIPFYNAQNFLKETLDSIIKQSITDWEVILIDDGSTDNSYAIASSYVSENIKLYQQSNCGVSIARNEGFKKAKGKYVVFLDADDILSNNFLEQRFLFLEQNNEYGFCCGDIIMFEDTTNKIIWKHKGVYENIAMNLLNYNETFKSVPSNYMFRRDVLIKHGILFNPILSSTADRYFLLELSLFSKCGYVPDAPLWYRYHPNSMSAKLSLKLIKDNELFYKLIEITRLYNREYKKYYKVNKYYVLGLSYLKIHHIKGIYFLFIGFLTHPYLFIKKIIIVILKKINAKKV